MKYKECSFSETFPLPNGHYQKIFVTAELEGTDDPRQALYEVKKVVHSFFYESNKAAEKQSEEQKIGIDVAIEACKTVKELESLKLLTRNDETLIELYRKKLIELS